MPPITETIPQTQAVVSHNERFTSDNMAMKIVDEYHDCENHKLNLIFHNALEFQAAQQSERVSDDVKFVTYIAKDIEVSLSLIVLSVWDQRHLTNLDCCGLNWPH